MRFSNRAAKYFGVIIATAFLCVIIPMKAQAAVLSLETEKNEAAVGEKIKASLFLDTRGQNINTLEAKIVFSSELLEFKEIREEGSIVSFWLEPPALFEGNKISLAGAIPGGFSGNKGLITSVIFTAKQPGKADFKMENIRVLLNDKNGTELHTIWPERSIIIKDEKVSEENANNNNSPKDNKSPEPFQPLVANYEDIFGGQWFVAFQTRDEGVGVSHYEVQETKLPVPKEEAWIKIEKSPYLLKDQELRSYIFVRAVDKEGNARTEMLYPQNKPNYGAYFLAILSLVVLFTAGKLFLKKKRFFKNETGL